VVATAGPATTVVVFFVARAAPAVAVAPAAPPGVVELVFGLAACPAEALVRASGRAEAPDGSARAPLGAAVTLLADDADVPA
jgi:hypothetical protein